jgi:hypothetical protein
MISGEHMTYASSDYFDAGIAFSTRQNVYCRFAHHPHNDTRDIPGE